jgi:xylose isomerase
LASLSTLTRRPARSGTATCSAFEEFDAEAAGAQGYGFVKLHQPAIDRVLRAE